MEHDQHSILVHYYQHSVLNNPDPKARRSDPYDYEISDESKPNLGWTSSGREQREESRSRSRSRMHMAAHAASYAHVGRSNQNDESPQI